jgi:hypothetical protein
MHTNRLITTTGSVLAIAAITAGPAAARSTDLRSPDARDAAAGRYLGSVHADLRSPDARDAASGRYLGSVHADLRSPDARDAATRTPVIVRVVPGPAASDPGLSWDSAAIGALAGAGLLVSMAGGGLLVVRRRSHVARPAA